MRSLSIITLISFLAFVFLDGRRLTSIAEHLFSHHGTEHVSHHHADIDHSDHRHAGKDHEKHNSEERSDADSMNASHFHTLTSAMIAWFPLAQPTPPPTHYPPSVGRTYFGLDLCEGHAFGILRPPRQYAA